MFYKKMKKILFFYLAYNAYPIVKSYSYQLLDDMGTDLDINIYLNNGYHRNQRDILKTRG